MMENDYIERGRRKGAKYVIVVLDTFDYDDYPVFIFEGEDLEERKKEYDGVNMQRILEVVEL